MGRPPLRVFHQELIAHEPPGALHGSLKYIMTPDDAPASWLRLKSVPEVEVLLPGKRPPGPRAANLNGGFPPASVREIGRAHV